MPWWRSNTSSITTEHLLHTKHFYILRILTIAFDFSYKSKTSISIFKWEHWGSRGWIPRWYLEESGPKAGQSESRAHAPVRPQSSHNWNVALTLCSSQPCLVKGLLSPPAQTQETSTWVSQSPFWVNSLLPSTDGGQAISLHLSSKCYHSLPSAMPPASSSRLQYPS